MKLESLKNSKFQPLKASSMSNIVGGIMENGHEATPATTGTNRYDSGEKDHGKATADCITWKNGVLSAQEFWHGDGYTCTWSQ